MATLIRLSLSFGQIMASIAMIGDATSLSLVDVKTMSNSGLLSGYSGRIAALQLNSGPLRITPVLDAHITFH